MKNKLIIFIILLIPFIFFITFSKNKPAASKEPPSFKKTYWFVLQRKSEKELLYYGKSGDVNNSRLIKTFQVKSGSISSPTPLPKLLGRDYWLIIKKESSEANPDTAPYFLTLDIPVSEEWPYGPTPYIECENQFTGDKGQCEWGFPGFFGLHGVNGNETKLSKEDPGSFGCIRHRDADIIYLYNLLDPEKEEVRYYVEDI